MTQPKTYTFFVNNQKYETEQQNLTGAQIKQFVPSAPVGSILYLEGKGNDPDEAVPDDKTINLGEHGDERPKRFLLVPPATFGRR